MSNRSYTNIKQIPVDKLSETYKFCFTFTVPRLNKIFYVNNKGILHRKNYGAMPFKAQCHFLVKNIMSEALYYFEQHADTRFHVHGYCECSALEMLNFMKDRFEDIRCQKEDIQDKLFLTEIVAVEPAWTTYCKKEQPNGHCYSHDIDLFLQNFLDNKKKDIIPTYIQDHIDELNFCSDDSDTEYSFGKKSPTIVFEQDETGKWKKTIFL